MHIAARDRHASGTFLSTTHSIHAVFHISGIFMHCHYSVHHIMKATIILAIMNVNIEQS